jgi:hypothetical protein
MITKKTDELRAAGYQQSIFSAMRLREIPTR